MTSSTLIVASPSCRHPHHLQHPSERKRPMRQRSTHRRLVPALLVVAALLLAACSSPPAGPGVHWVRPGLVAEIGFAEWTQNGRLRQPRFEGLRTDKSPRECRRERPRRNGGLVGRILGVGRRRFRPGGVSLFLPRPVVQPLQPRLVRCSPEHGRGRSSWRIPSVAGHRLAPPSDSLPADPIWRGILQATCCGVSADSASASSISCRPQDKRCNRV